VGVAAVRTRSKGHMDISIASLWLPALRSIVARNLT
jgi:hypothetical protein